MPCHRLRQTLVAGGLITASLAITACGTAGSPVVLNTERVERAIEHSSLTERGQHAQVSCPSAVHQAKGVTFICSAAVKRTTTRFVVTQLDGSGHVHYEGR
jgi:Domain of unknown function (DUF4333)